MSLNNSFNVLRPFSALEGLSPSLELGQLINVTSMPQPETAQQLDRCLFSGKDPCAISHSSFQTLVISLKISFCYAILISFF